MKYYFLFLISMVGYSLHAQQIHFVPTSFSNSFSLNVQPALKIKSGDSVAPKQLMPQAMIRMVLNDRKVVIH